MPKESRKQITDIRVLAALAHPVRVELLDYLLSAGPQTATRCADVAGATPSACSYHLRHMERHGLVERVSGGEGADGRERLWRAAATGFSFGNPPSSDRPADRATRRTLGMLGVERNADLAARYVDASGTIPPEWQDAAAFATYGLRMSADELEELISAIDALIRPYISLTRDDAPDGAERVHLTLQAFRRIDRA